MSVELIKYAFIAGEISRTLFGRTDLTKYDLGVALAKNWFVDYRGGLSTRPCTEFLDYIKDDDKAVKFAEFQFSPDLANTYVLLFGNNYVRFVQDGAYVLTEEKIVTSITPSAGQITVLASFHGYQNGDWVKLSGVEGIEDLNGFSFVVSDRTTSTFKLKDPRTGDYVNRDGQVMTSVDPAVFKIYEIETPYSADDLEGLSVSQVRDLLRLTHADFPIYNLTRVDHDNWTLAEEEIGGLSFSTSDWGLQVVPSSSGNMSAVYTVAAIMDDGDESTPDVPVQLSKSVNYTVDMGSVRVSWDPIPGAVEYIVYRSVIAGGTQTIPAGTQVGFIGRTKATVFVDANIIADFTKAPYEHYNPFAPSKIESITLTAAGTGYKFLSPVTVSGGTGSGFSGYAIADENGGLSSVVILNAGSGYSTPVTVTIGGGGIGAISSISVTDGGSGYTESTVPVTVTGGAGTGFTGYGVSNPANKIDYVVITNGGTNYSEPLTIVFGGSGTGATATGTVTGGGIGATATATLTPAAGIYPSISAIFQQRQIYAASLEHPLTLWGSKISYYSNFDSSPFVADNDSYEFDIDAAQISPILHMFSLRGGLVLLSQTGIWLLTAGEGPVTPTNALADLQNFTGVSKVRPLQIGSDLLYIEGKGYAVRLLSYNDFSKVYSGEDKSILSNHLFSKDRQIIEWAFAENPYKVVFGVRSDGALVMFTSVKEQDVYAWTWGQTRGLFRNILSIPENGRDSVYTVVERIIEGVHHKYLERFVIDEWNLIEDAHCVDCGLRLSPPDITDNVLNISAEFIEDDMSYVTMTAASSIFTDTEGYWVRAAGGIFVIRSVTSDTEAKAQVIFPATQLWPEDKEHRVIPQSVWSLAEPIKTLSGLFHLEGEEVSILGDGNVFPKQTVVDGKITLPDGITKASVGMGIQAVMQTLPPTVTDVPIEARRKRVVGIAVRLDRSRGLEIGRDLDDLYPLRERTNEAYGTPIIPLNGYRYQVLPTNWDEDAQTYFVQSDPLPASILALVPDMDIGDDTD